MSEDSARMTRKALVRKAGMFALLAPAALAPACAGSPRRRRRCRPPAAAAARPGPGFGPASRARLISLLSRRGRPAAPPASGCGAMPDPCRRIGHGTPAFRA